MSGDGLNGHAWKRMAFTLAKVAAASAALAGTLAIVVAGHHDTGNIVGGLVDKAQTTPDLESLRQPVRPQERFSGLVIVYEPDTWRVGTRWVRLWGLDAPETSQPCLFPGDTEPKDCGRLATQALRKHLYLGEHVECLSIVRGRRDTHVAVCKNSAEEDLGLWMLEQGWAVADEPTSDEYVAAMERAREARKGMWRSQMEPPRVFRERHGR